MNKRQLRFHHVKNLTFTAGYARREAQVHADMRLVEIILQEPHVNIYRIKRLTIKINHIELLLPLLL